LVKLIECTFLKNLEVLIYESLDKTLKELLYNNTITFEDKLYVIYSIAKGL